VIAFTAGPPFRVVTVPILWWGPSRCPMPGDDPEARWEGHNERGEGWEEGQAQEL
jgi:hypothetical protein